MSALFLQDIWSIVRTESEEDKENTKEGVFKTVAILVAWVCRFTVFYCGAPEGVFFLFLFCSAVQAGAYGMTLFNCCGDGRAKV